MKQYQENINYVNHTDAAADSIWLTSTNGGIKINSANGNLDVDAKSVNIDSTDTTNGIQIGRSSTNVPVKIGADSSVVTIGQHLTVTGNLTVNGTTTTVNTAEILLEDNKITLNAGQDQQNAGIIVDRSKSNGADSSDPNVQICWNEADDKWLLVDDASTAAFYSLKLKDLEATNDLTVDGDAEIKGTLNVTGGLDFSNNLELSKDSQTITHSGTTGLAISSTNGYVDVES